MNGEGAFSLEQIIAAHEHCIRHRESIASSEICGCFYCEQVFPPSEIEIWLDDGPDTALCPRCGIDAVIGSATCFPVNNPAFLKAMNEYWFQRTEYIERP